MLIYSHVWCVCRTKWQIWRYDGLSVRSLSQAPGEGWIPTWHASVHNCSEYRNCTALWYITNFIGVLQTGCVFTWLYCIYNLPSCFSLLPIWSVMQTGIVVCMIHRNPSSSPQNYYLEILCVLLFSAIGTPVEKCILQNSTHWTNAGKITFGVTNLLWKA